MSHTLPRVSFHLKTRQEYFFYDEESFGMLKTGFGGTWYSTLFGAPFADFFLGEWAKMGYLANYCSVSPHFCCNDIFINRHCRLGQLVVRYGR